MYYDELDDHDEYWDQLRADIEYAEHSQAMQEIYDRDGDINDYDSDEIPLQPDDQADEDEDTIEIHPLSALMNRKRREELVENLLFRKGITTLVAQSGEGKTTTAASIAVLVAAGGMTWGEKKIPQRPVLWIAGEGEDDLPGMIEAVAKEHGLDWKKLPITICFEAVNFADRGETDKLIEKLKVPMLIVADALADIMAAGEKDEDKSKDITLVYKNVRRVEKKTRSVFLIPHHEGWNGDHERGSTAIRANSDILVRIIKFEADRGYIKFMHKKRRGGPKLKDFAYEVKLVQVERCKHLVPIVTGKPKNPFDLVLSQDMAADEEHARDLVRIVAAQSRPVRHGDLKTLSAKSKSTFKRGLDAAVDGMGWLIKEGRGYALNPNRSWEAALAVAPGPLAASDPNGSTLKNIREWTQLDPNKPGPVGSTGPKLDPNGPKSSTDAEEALAVTLDTEAILKKAEKR
jgi:predicted transposase YbfD/YdcC